MTPNVPAKPYRGSTSDPVKATRDAMFQARAGVIPLVEIFYSLQGEGLRVGEATVFIRVAGCNLACDFCDTDFSVREVMAVDAVVREVEALGRGCRWVCLTGGEPTIHDLEGLCRTLHGLGYRVQLETNGTRPKPLWKVDHITVSPKQPQGGALDSWYLENATEFKYIVDDERDLERAFQGVQSHGKPTFLQPNALNPAAIALCVDAVKSTPDRLRLSLQSHKFINIR